MGGEQPARTVFDAVVPLPPGVPYDQQQFHAVMAEHGVLAVEDAAQAELAQRISAHL
jgi:dTDP-4-amino-4,6-dideoxygalactose transaminase